MRVEGCSEPEAPTLIPAGTPWTTCRMPTRLSRSQNLSPREIDPPGAMVAFRCLTRMRGS